VSSFTHLIASNKSRQSVIHRLLVNDDIDAIIQRGEERTVELNNKYEGLNLEDLSNFKSEASVQQWEGEDFRTGVRQFTICSVIHSYFCPSATQALEFQPAVSFQA
jgi:hypothetical protein